MQEAHDGTTQTSFSPSMEQASRSADRGTGNRPALHAEPGGSRPHCAETHAPHRRLGLALVLCYLRHPNRVVERHEEVPPALLAFIADQVQARPQDLAEYRRRDPSRRQHLADLLAHTGQRPFDRKTSREMASWLVSIAQVNREPFGLAHALVEELRRQRILLPTATVLELILHQARGRAKQFVNRVLGDALLPSKDENQNSFPLRSEASSCPAIDAADPSPRSPSASR
jgi:hypothetical protein